MTLFNNATTMPEQVVAFRARAKRVRDVLHCSTSEAALIEIMQRLDALFEAEKERDDFTNTSNDEDVISELVRLDTKIKLALARVREFVMA